MLKSLIVLFFSTLCLNFDALFQASGSGPIWVAVFSSSTYLAASLVVRGPVALNVLLFYTGTMDLRDVSETLSSDMKKVDALASVPYAGDLRESISKNHIKLRCNILKGKTSCRCFYFFDSIILKYQIYVM